MNTPVSFEIAKLLKEKGFNEPCIAIVTKENKHHLVSGTEHTLINGIVFTTAKNKGLPDHIYSAPTIADVVCWIYEKHKIWISVDPHNDTDTWFYTISHNKSEIVFGNYNGPIEAYDAAIEHILNEMI